jgi:lipoprotein-anchoring transpeptidase ErfK/SrfK
MTRRAASRRWITAGIAALLVLVIGGAAVRVVPPPPPKRVVVAPPPPMYHRPPALPVPALTTIAKVTGALRYSARPGGRPVGAIPVGSWWGQTKELPVVARVPGWLEVRLPQRPNGLTGWIPARSARLSTTRFAILVDVTTTRLQLWHAGRLLYDLPAGVGTHTDPTPLGVYYVMDVAPPEGPGWGPFILDTNAHSEAIQDWEGSGDAFTAIHGPLGADAAIGTTGGDISHGCIRLHDADLAKLAGVPPGTPVIITSSRTVA